MKNKLYADPEYNKLEETYDVIGLLNKIEALTFTTEATQHEYLLLTNQLRALIGPRQNFHEDPTPFYKWWSQELSVLEQQWGDFMPTKLKMGADNAKEKKRFQALLFLQCLNTTQWGSYLDELNNDYLNGNTDIYPTSVEAAVNILNNSPEHTKKNKKKKAPSSSNNNSNTNRDDTTPPNVTSFNQRTPRRDENYESDTSDVHGHCPECGQMYVSHTPCNNCGYYSDDYSHSSHATMNSPARRSRPPTPAPSTTGWSG